MEFKSTVCGIPCIISVTHYESTPSTYWEPSNYECEYDILDRKGYRAKWLERKIDANQDARIQELIAEHLTEENYGDC